MNHLLQYMYILVCVHKENCAFHLQKKKKNQVLTVDKL